MTWDGKERRKFVDADLRDMIIRMDANLTHSVEWQKKHEETDNIRFVEVNDKLKPLEQFYWKCLGGVAVIVIIVNIALKVIVK